jgi:hypothetical protein
MSKLADPLLLAVSGYKNVKPASGEAVLYCLFDARFQRGKGPWGLHLDIEIAVVHRPDFYGTMNGSGHFLPAIPCHAAYHPYTILSPETILRYWLVIVKHTARVLKMYVHEVLVYHGLKMERPYVGTPQEIYFHVPPGTDLHPAPVLVSLKNKALRSKG